MWSPTVIVFAGGGLGAIIRELSMLMFGRYSAGFPVDIFAANIIASFMLGLIVGLHQDRRASDHVVLLISTGICGGMSTFSSFIYGAYSEMMRPGELGLSTLYVIASLVIGYSVAWLGLHAAAGLRRG